MLHALRAIVLRIATSSVRTSSTALARYIEQPTAQQHWSAKTPLRRKTNLDLAQLSAFYCFCLDEKESLRDNGISCKAV